MMLRRFHVGQDRKGETVIVEPYRHLDLSDNNLGAQAAHDLGRGGHFETARQGDCAKMPHLQLDIVAISCFGRWPKPRLGRIGTIVLKSTVLGVR